MKQVGENPTTEKPPTQRDMRSFEADDDVGCMLDRANGEGVKTVFLCNKALREYLTKKGYARKGDLTTKG